MLDDFKIQLNKIDNIFFRMIDQMEEFLLEYIQISRLIPTLFSSSSSSELKVQFNNRVNKNIEQDINQCISHLCDWLLERSNRTIQQLNKHLNTSSIDSRKQQQQNQKRTSHITSSVDTDFSRSRQQILNQLQAQCQNVKFCVFLEEKIRVMFFRFCTNKKQQPADKLMTSRHRFVPQ